jgi:hypothetical protein
MEFISILFASLEHVADKIIGWFDLDFWEAAFLLAVVLFVVVLVRATANKENDFDFSDLLMDQDRDGKRRASLRKLTAWGCFLVHSWFTARMAAYREISIEFGALYVLTWSGVYLLAPITNAIAERAFGVKIANQTETTSTTSTSTTSTEGTK